MRQKHGGVDSFEFGEMFLAFEMHVESRFAVHARGANVAPIHALGNHVRRICGQGRKLKMYRANSIKGGDIFNLQSYTYLQYHGFD